MQAGIRCVKNAEASRFTTIKTGGTVKELYFPCDVEELCGILRRFGEDLPVFGGFSDVIIGDGGMERAVCTSRIDGIVFSNGVATVGCGVKLPVFSARACEKGLSGLEFACGIPASVGGAVKMNAGAFGGEIKNVLRSATVFHDGKLEVLPCDELALGYRKSGFHGKVVCAEFELGIEDGEEIKRKMRKNLQLRRETQPQLPSAGSFFKRVNGVSAGYYIDEAGLKGLCVGGAQVSEKHAGFIVNTGRATSKDVVELAERIKDGVFRAFGIILEEEIGYYGRF